MAQESGPGSLGSKLGPLSSFRKAPMLILWALAGIAGASAIQFSKLKQVKVASATTPKAVINPAGFKPTWEEFIAWEPSDVIRNVGVWLNPIDWVATQLGLPTPTDLLTDQFEGGNNVGGTPYGEIAQKGVNVLDSASEGKDERHGAGSGQAVIKRVFAEMSTLPGFDLKAVYNRITEVEFNNLKRMPPKQIRAFIEAEQAELNNWYARVKGAGF